MLQRKRLLGVAAHADDLEFSSAGTIARWIKEGWEAYYLICTDGSKGSDDPKMTPQKLARVRREEQQRAAKILGVKKVYFLDHPDTELVADQTLKEEITYYIRKLRPQRVVTMNPAVFFWKKRHFVNHTDHRAVSIATIDSVFPLARDRLTFPQHEKQGLKPHKAEELFLVTIEEANYISDVTDTWNIKLKALRAHKSQVSEEAINRITEWAKENGKEKGYKYAEKFIRLELP